MTAAWHVFTGEHVSPRRANGPFKPFRPQSQLPPEPHRLRHSSNHHTRSVWSRCCVSKFPHLYLTYMLTSLSQWTQSHSNPPHDRDLLGARARPPSHDLGRGVGAASTRLARGDEDQELDRTRDEEENLLEFGDPRYVSPRYLESEKRLTIALQTGSARLCRRFTWSSRPR